MNRIGVAVEGPSDRAFWDRLLHKEFKGTRFDVRNLKSREKLIRETPKLLESFRGMHYRAVIILLDMDTNPCVTSVLELFDRAVFDQAREPRPARYLHVCLAIKNLESWYLADEQAIAAVIPGCDYDAPSETARLGKGRLLELLRQANGKDASYNELHFAKQIASRFSPHRAQKCSASFAYFWGIMASKV